MFQSANRAPWLILGTALMGAMLVSLLSASPTPAQVSGTPTPTTAPAATQAPTRTPTPTINLSGLTGLQGLNLPPELNNIPGEISKAATQLAQQGPISSSSGGAAMQFSNSLGAQATPTSMPTSTPATTPTHTAVATSLTQAAILTFGTAVATSATAVGTPAPATTEVAAPVPTAEVVPTQPMMSVDTPEAGGTIANGRALLVGGWIIDPRIDGAGVVAVDVFVDGKPGTGKFVGAADQSLSREDVASYFQRPDWDRSGFQYEWMPNSLAPGQHTLVVVAQLAAGDSISSETPFTVR